MTLGRVSQLTAAGLSLTGFLASAPSAPVQGSENIPWIQMPLLSAGEKAAGVFPGGEGGQWPRNPIAVSPADPDFLLLPIDVGGLYRSLDGGATWTVSMVGWDARGANAFAIDPKNAEHVLGVGSNSINWDRNWGPSPNGLYLSKNKAGSWKHVLARLEGATGAVAWDPSSFDVAKGFCTRAYYSGYGIGLHRSDDGGETWQQVGGPLVSAPLRDWTQGPNGTGLLKIGADGAVYTAGVEGLFRSDDRGATFSKLRAGEVDGLDLAPDGTLFVCSADGIFASRDHGEHFDKLPGKGLEARGKGSINGIVVSPADPQRLLCWLVPMDPSKKPDFRWPRYVSWDGGTTWQEAGTDSTLAALPANGRQGYSTWSPKDPNIVWGIGGDWATKSTDGGKNFHWSNNGYNGIMLGGLFAFNVHSPETVFLGFQDYNGAFTINGGRTWNYRDVSGMGWGGQEYGGFALSKDVMWSGDAGTSWSAPRRLRITRDGGNTWTFANGADGKPIQWSGPDVSAGDPGDPRVGFASNLRTADGGLTWMPMSAADSSNVGCDGVFAASPTTRMLYGKSRNSVVRSADHGATWQKVADVSGGFVDLAVDGKMGRIYVASEDRLKVWQNGAWSTIDTPADQFGNQRVCTVATDPADPEIVYVGGPRNTYASAATICRSTDGGRTWRNLTVTAPLRPGQNGGPHEVGAIRVNPATREAWVAGQCYGLWRIAPPAPGEKGVPAALASAPRSLPPIAASEVMLSR